MPTFPKPLAWIGSSKKDLMALPLDVRKFFGHALDFAQRGDKHDGAKVLKGFGGAGVLELIEDAPSQLPVYPYEARTWGPGAADNLLAEDGLMWRRP